jgi:hypothetical protein
MTTKHTPGPWTDKGTDWHGWAVEYHDDCAWCFVGPPKKTPVAIIIGKGVGMDIDANARLIAAAPDLMAALQGVVAVADRATVEFDAARAAIAKATGGAT